MAKRIRRFTMTVEGATVAGARDFRYDDNSEYDRSRADDEVVGDQVRMSTGPYAISFELLAPDSNVESGLVDALVVTAKQIERSGASESSTDITYTFAQGNLNVGGDVPTENAGRIPVTGEFKTLAIS